MTTWDIINYTMLVDFALFRGVQLFAWMKRLDFSYTITLTKGRLIAAVGCIAIVIGAWKGVVAAGPIFSESNAYYGTCQGVPCPVGGTRRLVDEDKTSQLYSWNGHSWRMIGK